MLFLFRFSLVTCFLGGALSVPLLSAQMALAQSGLPDCPPPATQEYLLLVRGDNEADRADISAILPAENTVLVCQYLNEVLVRVGGFTSLETANAWATYLTTVEGYESFVSRSAEPDLTVDGTTTGGTMANAATATTATTIIADSAAAASAAAAGDDGKSAGGYQPVRLGVGYAVLVEYGDRPEVAATVGQFVRPVGLAVYRQRAYLLADYTSDAVSAATTLQRLYDAQLSAILVDSQQVVRMSAEVVR